MLVSVILADFGDLKHRLAMSGIFDIASRCFINIRLTTILFSVLVSFFWILPSSAQTSIQISGVVFEDLNSNGTPDSGEPKLSGRKVELFNGPEFPPDTPPYCCVDYLTETTTNSGGAYTFTGLVPSQTSSQQNYRVRHIVSAGYIKTTDDSKYWTGVTSNQVHNFGIKSTTAPPPPGPVPSPSRSPRPTPLIIYDVRVYNRSINGATVTWTTNISADTQIEICRTYTRCSNNTPLISQLTTSHTVNLSNLSANTKYYFWVKSRAGQDSADIGYFILRTRRLDVYDVWASNITTTSAKITWTTNVSTTGQLEFCPTYARCGNMISSGSSPNTTHTVNLTGLKPGKIYYYWVIARDGSGNQIDLGYFGFRTRRISVYDAWASSITTTSAIITWTTNVPTSGVIELCITPAQCGNEIPETSFTTTTSHRIELSGLTPRTYYYYWIKVTDGQGNLVTMGPFGFGTRR